MTLDEAIRHADEVANRCTGECAADHHQLAEWLRELKQYRERFRELCEKLHACVRSIDASSHDA